MKQIEGQLSLFDIRDTTKKRRPCEYSFERYIGQRVVFKGGIAGTVTEIEPYYTTIKTDDGGELAGTPTTISPLKTCGACAHFREVVSGLGEIYHSTACLKDRPWANFKEPEDPACEYYTRAET